MRASKSDDPNLLSAHHICSAYGCTHVCILASLIIAKTHMPNNTHKRPNTYVGLHAIHGNQWRATHTGLNTPQRLAGSSRKNVDIEIRLNRKLSSRAPTGGKKTVMQALQTGNFMGRKLMIQKARGKRLSMIETLLHAKPQSVQALKATVVLASKKHWLHPIRTATLILREHHEATSHTSFPQLKPTRTSLNGLIEAWATRPEAWVPSQWACLGPFR